MVRAYTGSAVIRSVRRDHRAKATGLAPGPLLVDLLLLPERQFEIDAQPVGYRTEVDHNIGEFSSSLCRGRTWVRSQSLDPPDCFEEFADFLTEEEALLEDSLF
jgi:hypothetical protein